MVMFASALVVGVSPVVLRLFGIMPANGTGLLYGEGLITPAISVISAVEGLRD